MQRSQKCPAREGGRERERERESERAHYCVVAHAVCTRRFTSSGEDVRKEAHRQNNSRRRKAAPGEASARRVLCVFLYLDDECCV